MEKNKTHLFFPLFVLAIYGLLLASRLLTRDMLSYGGNYYLSLIVIQLLIFAVPAALFCRTKEIGYAEKLNFRLFPPSTIGIILLSALLLIAASWLIRLTQLVASGAETAAFSLYGSFSPGSVTNAGDAIYITLAFAVTPAVTEEFLYRGLLFTEYSNAGHGWIVTTLLSSLLFAMMHFSPTGFPIYFVGGLVFSGLTYVSRSVIPAMIAHFLFNFYSLFGEGYVLKVMSKADNLVLVLFLFGTLFLLFLIGYLSEGERINAVSGVLDVATPAYAEERAKVYPKRSDRARHAAEALFSPFFLLCIVTYLVVVFMFRN